MCCAAGALVLLSVDPNSTLLAKDLMARCGRTCVGAGDTADQGPAGCEGLLYQPSPDGGECPRNSTMLLNFQGNPRYGGTNRHGICKGPECPAVLGKTVKIHPRGNRPVRVRAMPVPNVPLSTQQADTIIEFKHNTIPPKSKIIGPLTIQCSGHHKRLTVGAGSELNQILLRDCNETCPVNVQLTRKDGDTHTEIYGVRFMTHQSRSDVLAEASMCVLLVTPVPSKNHPRDFVGRGRVSFRTAYSHNVAIANVNGKIGITNTDANGGTAVVTLLDTLEDANGRLVLETVGKTQLRNLTAVMRVFSQEYMVDYFGPSDERRRDVQQLKAFNWTVLGLLIALLAQSPKAAHTVLLAPEPGQAQPG